MNLLFFYSLIILSIILMYELCKRISFWLTKEIQILWKYWSKKRQIHKNVVIELDEDEIQPHIANTSHIQNSTRPSDETNSDNLSRLGVIEEKLSRIEEAFNWNLDTGNSSPITVAKINEGNLTYIVVVESSLEHEEELPPGQQNRLAIRPRFVKRPKEINEF